MKTKLLHAAVVAVAVAATTPAHATVIKRTVSAAACRFGSYATCAATGECLEPPELAAAAGNPNFNVWQLDQAKLQPKSQFTHTGYPLSFVCPFTRVFKNGGSGNNPPVFNVQVAMQTPGNNLPVTCVVYSSSKYGLPSQSVNISVTKPGPQKVIKGGAITTSVADGDYTMWCTLDNTVPDTSGAALYSYRAEEFSQGTNTKWRTYTGTRCVGTGTGVSTKIRYFANKATNVDGATRNVTCPAHEIEGQATSLTPPYTATVMVNEKQAAGGSKCKLVARAQDGPGTISETPFIKTTKAGDATLALAILPQIDQDPLRYSVDCTLTAGSSVYQYFMGH